MSKRKDIWAAWVNLRGLAFQTPRKCKWDDELKSWWYHGDWDVNKVGQDVSAYGGAVTFASYNKKEVQLWIDGYRTSAYFLYDYIRSSLEEDQK